MKVSNGLKNISAHNNFMLSNFFSILKKLLFSKQRDKIKNQFKYLSAMQIEKYGNTQKIVWNTKT